MITLSSSQQAALDKIVAFMREMNDAAKPGIFVLKGYAGTGKTTLITSIIEQFLSKGLSYRLMAPTGRAAKVLRDKIDGCGARTIHSSIYAGQLEPLDNGNEADMSDNDYRLAFPLIKDEKDIDCIIVDESSMVSDAIDHSDLLQFGSGQLLTDLLTYAKLSKVKTIIFVGDTAQLPPVTDSASHALDIQYFADKGYVVDSAELTDVFRQARGGEILATATQLRETLSMPKGERYALKFDMGNEIEGLKSTEVADRYVAEFGNGKIGGGVVVCYSNRLCYDTNLLVRYKLYGQWDAELQKGDLMIVNNNCYGVFGKDIYNGDLMKVTAIGQRIVRKNVPVTFDGIKSHINLNFREVEVLFHEEEAPVRCCILENLLTSPNREISEVERRALYIDFCIRMREKGIKPQTVMFKSLIRSDRFFNALRVKYGYAITCHKAQGGEWQKVIVDFSGMCRLDDMALRWYYTAITRAREKLYVVNRPNISQYSRMKFSEIDTIIKLPNDFFDPSIDVTTPFHGEKDLVAAKLKCRGIIAALANTTLELRSVEHFNWRERYHFIDRETGKSYTIDATYKSGGVFSRVMPKGGDEVEAALCEIINKSFDYSFVYNYAPSTPVLQEHYELMRSVCDETGITITNVIECLNKYYVIYYLATSAFATMQFYMQGNMFTAVMPKSLAGGNDEKLKQLISKLQ